MATKNRPALLAALAGAFIFQGVWNNVTLKPFWNKNYAPASTGIAEGLSPDQLLFTLAGFREMIAGILWVRADSFFETGNYDAILPLIRLVTWLDPHQIDVYSTGMWHIGYNFTDEQQRADRRYTPSALALGKEGARNNPNTYEMYFETGWMWYHKVDDDYSQAVKWFEKAGELPDIQPARRNILGMAYQRNGQIDKAIEYYGKLYHEAQEAYDKAPIEGKYEFFALKETRENNYDNTIMRSIARGYQGNKAGMKAPIAYDTEPPFDVGFSARVTIPESRQIRFEGSWGVRPVGTRVRVVLKDADYPMSAPGGMIWDQGDSVNLDPPKDVTYMQDQLFVKNRRFDRTCDMAKDPTMYPFAKDKYVIEFYYNARSAPPHIQDKFGWNGEGLTDKNFLNTEIRKGARVVFARMELTKDMILRRNEWADELPVIQTKNFAPSTGRSGETIIEVPSLLGAGK